MPEELNRACHVLRIELIHFIEWFLWIAIVIAALGALAELVTKLAPLFNKSTYPPARAAVPVDPVKLIDSIKNLIDALTRAPAWIALFLAALALLWVTQGYMPSFCPIAAH
jgi:hypothetical protein